MITEGLSVMALVNLDSESHMWQARTKTPAIYYADGRDRKGGINLKESSATSKLCIPSRTFIKFSFQ